jgi:hypothetical protein
MMAQLTVVNMKEFAREMMDVFPKPSDVSCAQFAAHAQKAHGESASFVDGWLDAHKDLQTHVVSMLYLSALIGALPEDVITKFPIGDLRKCGGTGKLAARRMKLTNSSFRFMFLVSLIVLMYHLNLKYRFV